VTPVTCNCATDVAAARVTLVGLAWIWTRLPPWSRGRFEAAKPPVELAKLSTGKHAPCLDAGSRPPSAVEAALHALRQALGRRPGLLQDATIDPGLNALFRSPDYRRLLAPAPAPAAAR
jgi:hypothetical protein